MNNKPTPRLVILALDLGTTTGWALRSANGPVAHGFVSFKSQRFEGGGMRYLRFGRWLDDMLALTGSESDAPTDSAVIGAVYFEEVRRHLGVDAAHVYGGLLATLTAWCERHQIPGGHWQDTMTERCAWARKRLGEALDAVGGISSPGGCAVWHVAGLGQSVKEWSAQEGWNGRTLNQYEAKGILVGALGVLAVHYGYSR